MRDLDFANDANEVLSNLAKLLENGKINPIDRKQVFFLLIEIKF